MSSELVEELLCMVLPLHKTKLVIPSVAVAEVNAYSEIASNRDEPAWFLGFWSWRECQIPLVDFELANEMEEVEKSNPERIIIFNALAGLLKFPFFAIPIQGIPHQSRVLPGDLVTLSLQTGRAAQAVVEIHSEYAMIPDLVVLENMIHELDI